MIEDIELPSAVDPENHRHFSLRIYRARYMNADGEGAC